MTTLKIKELKLQDKSKEKCDVCGTELDDDGLCPNCDLGETESVEDDAFDESLDEEEIE